MIRTTLLIAASLLLAPTAQADTFHLGSKADAERVQNDEELGLQSLANTVSGVLLEEADGYYKVRTVGGVTFLRKADVYKIEKDALTVAKIEDMEQQDEEAAVEANQMRRQMLAAERNARMEQRMIAMEASSARSDVQAMDAAAVSTPVVAPAIGFDPVLGVAVPATAVPLTFALELQYERVPTPRNAKLMRMARRLR